METRQVAAEQAQHLTFSIDGDEYGVTITEAREIIRYQQLTRVPVAPAWVRGVVNLRGSVVPVLDLSVKLGGAPRQITQRSCIVVLDVAQGDGVQTLGLLADQVNQVTAFEAAALTECPSFGLARKRELLRGLGRQGDGFVLLLDVQKLMAGDAGAEWRAEANGSGASGPAAAAADATGPDAAHAPD
jgi:purine-binding chemotaxis protein CheW